MEILNKTEIMERTGFTPNISLISFGVIIAILIILLIAGTIDFYDLSFVLQILFFALLIMMDIEYLIESEFVSSGRYQYEVIISKDYPAMDLYENYKVVEQRGKIWVIEDKKND